MIVIIPTGGSNLGSVVAACDRLGVKTLVSEDPSTICRAARVVLPGVGHAAAMMERLRARGLVEVIRDLRQPVLGICLGMQMLFQTSEEGGGDLLGVIPGHVRKIEAKGRTLPHMGWNRIAADGPDPFARLVDGKHGYFVHSFMADDGPWTVASTHHGSKIPALVRWRNFVGAQFHPEKSAATGRSLLQEFLLS